MDSDGHRGNSNSAAMLAALISRRDRFQEELRSIEKQVFELETSYLQEASHFGNALKGFEGFLSSSKNTSNLSSHSIWIRETGRTEKLIFQKAHERNL